MSIVEKTSSDSDSTNGETVNLADFLAALESKGFCLPIQAADLSKSRVEALIERIDVSTMALADEWRQICWKEVEELVLRRTEKIRRLAVIRSEKNRTLVSDYAKELQAKNSAIVNRMVEDGLSLEEIQITTINNADSSSLAVVMFSCEIEEIENRRFEEDLQRATDCSEFESLISNAIEEHLSRQSDCANKFISSIHSLRESISSTT